VKRILMLCFLLAVVTGTQAAEPLKSKDQMRTLTEEVVARAASGDFEGGLRLLAPYSIVPESEFEVVIEQARIQFPSMRARFGNAVGHEFFCAEEAGQSLYRIVQAVKYEKHMLRIRFVFYKPVDSWVLNTFYFDDQIEKLFCD
jgi:hypothetical protein